MSSPLRSDRVQRVRRGGLVACALVALGAAASGEEPRYDSRLRLPARGQSIGEARAVVADPHTGEIFVCDRRRHRVVIFDHEGLFRYSIPGGQTFRAPRDVAVFPDGTLALIANRDGERAILRLDFDGRFLRTVELAGPAAEGAAPPQLVSLAVALDGERLYALDKANLALWIARPDGRHLSRVDLAAGLDPDLLDELVLGHVDVYADAVLVAMPILGAVRIYSLDGELLHRVGLKGTAACQMAFPVAAALDVEGRLVVIDEQRALGMFWRVSDKRCLLEFSAIGTSPGALYRPTDVALDGRGRIYVSQGFEGRVQVFTGGASAAGASSPE